MLSNYRTKKIGHINKQDLGEKVTLSGWASVIRDHGGLIFIDLRDSSGKVQLVVDPELAKHIRQEFVIKIEGEVKLRAPDQINKNIPTGELEIQVSSLETLNSSDPLPFSIEDTKVSELVKYKYRYLSMRSEYSQKRVEARAEMFRTMRSFLSSEGFLEVDTPILGKSTPEGARDFLVPSRLHAGHFYALPQSPQIFKQLIVIGGVDRYYQIAKCFRDEDLRADRQPEFMQLDLEMAFVEERDVISLTESLVKQVLKNISNKEVSFSSMPYSEAMRDYGCDKPDISFDMKLVDITDICKEVSFKVFRNADMVKAINLKGKASISRKEIDDLTKYISTFGAKGLAWIKMKDGPQSVISKFFDESELNSMLNALKAEEGDILFFVADKSEVVNDSLSALRLKLADNYNLRREGLHFLWVRDFPMFEVREGGYKAVHHPFTMPKGDLSRAYDLVLNGHEIAGGSIRIHNYATQIEVFNKIGISKEQAEKQFGHLLSALRHGAPPHGGIAFGISRFLAILMGDESIRDVIPFPKTQRGTCLITEAPSVVNELDDLHISVKEQNDKS